MKTKSLSFQQELKIRKGSGWKSKEKITKIGLRLSTDNHFFLQQKHTKIKLIVIRLKATEDEKKIRDRVGDFRENKEKKAERNNTNWYREWKSPNTQTIHAILNKHTDTRRETWGEREKQDNFQNR